MKKLLYIIVIAITTSTVITSCTEEEVRPTGGSTAIGTSIDPFKSTR